MHQEVGAAYAATYIASLFPTIESESSASIPEKKHPFRTALIAGANGIFIALALTACGPGTGSTNINVVSAQTVPSILSNEEASCGNRLSPNQQDVIPARQNEAQELLRRGFSEAQMRARMQEYCGGLIPPQR